jgi:hypothetical protein
MQAEEDGWPSGFPTYGSIQCNADADIDDSIPTVAKKVFQPQLNLRSNLVPVGLSFLAPWLLFLVASASMSFSLRYSSSGISWLIIVICAFLTILAGAVAFLFTLVPPTKHHPAWYCILFALMVVALVVGTIVGDLNFHYNFQVYYDTTRLNVYENVDPSTQLGHMMNDAGVITFANGARPDQHHTMAFQSHEMYCVTPIVGPEGLPRGSVDFWAVGTDCCTNSRHGFHCGEYQNPQARGGLRVVHPKDETFFRLAVQKAEAAFAINAPNPVMFTWTQDPVQELNAIYSAGVHYYIVGLYSHLIFQVMVVALAISKLTKYGFQLAGGSLGDPDGP